jgi:hypothetical protein
MKPAAGKSWVHISCEFTTVAGSVEWLLLLLLPLLSLLPWDWDVFVSGVEVARPVGTTPSKSMVDGIVCLSIPLVVLRCQHSTRGLHSTFLRSRDLRADSLLGCFRFCFLSSLSSWTICTWYKHSLWWVGCIFLHWCAYKSTYIKCFGTYNFKVRTVPIGLLELNQLALCRALRGQRRTRSCPIVHSDIQVSCRGARNSSDHCTRLHWKHRHGLVYHSLRCWIRHAVLRIACTLTGYSHHLIKTGMRFYWYLSFGEKKTEKGPQIPTIFLPIIVLRVWVLQQKKMLRSLKEVVRR